MSQAFDARLREAVQLENAGRVVDAIAAYERLLAEWPALPESWFNLAVLRRKAGRFDAALDAYRHAIERGVSHPEEAHLNRGVIHADHLRQDAAAERELAAALALNPRYLPALLNLANLQEDLGRRDAALARGVPGVLLDPGLGFGKRLEHNLALLRNLEVFGEAGYPVFVGMSRKTMLGAITGRDVNERVFAGAAAALLAVQRGARIVRTHDVGATRDVLRVWAAVEADSHAGFAAKC